jgi:hypothetical protein
MTLLTRRSTEFSGLKRTVVLEWTLDQRDREAQRRALAEKWLGEEQYTNYRYNVEKCRDGKRVYLLRPTWLNKGFDFQVNLEGFSSVVKPSRRGPTKEMPSHNDVVHDLSEKVKASPVLTPLLFSAVRDVYDCRGVEEILDERPLLAEDSAGMPVEKLLLVLKWLFIEQDITYWLQTGRNMLMSGIEKDVFGL